MKKLLLSFIFFIALGTGLKAQEVKWMTMNEALQAQKEHPKKIFMDAYTIWCGPCKMLDKHTFSNKDVAKFINENYYPVKFNAEGTEQITYRGQEFGNPRYDPNRTGRNSQHEFAGAMRINAYPSLVFFDEEGDLIGPIPGYRTPHQLEVFLKLFLMEEYKKINNAEDFQEYTNNFKYEFEVTQ